MSHVHDRLDALADGELPPDETAALGAHLSACAECSAALEETLERVRDLRERLTPYRASDVLRGRVRAALRAEVASTSRSVPSAARVSARWRRLAAAVAVLCVTGGGAALTLARRGDGRVDVVAAREVESSHVRSLMLAHLLDVPSTDQHTVKPWFAGKVDFSPPVVRLDSLGTVLLGGRVDYVGGRPAAVVVYQRRRHVVSLYVWRADDERDAPVAAADVAGYHLLRWRDGGLELWAVSDLNPTELRQFASSIRSATPGTRPSP